MADIDQVRGPRRWSVEAWWWLERRSGRLWTRVADGRASCWFDPVPAWCYRRRKAAERRALGQPQLARR